MKLKTTEVNGKKYAELDAGGLPIYVHDDGKEVGFDAAQAVGKISSLNAEAKTHREAKEAAEKSLKVFEGLDPEKAKAALETMANLDAKKLVDAGEIEKVKAELTEALKKSYEPQIQQLTQERDSVQAQLHKELIGGGFARSKFIQEKIAVPADMIQATFGNNFKIEDGKVVAYGVDGQKIYSRTKHGEVADFDEALETLVGGYQHKDSILKGNQSTGGGYGGQGGGGNNSNVGNMGGTIQERQAAIAAKFNLDK
ncbi:hypothetical protein J671_3606 [Acinetobacter sp. 1130196]|uniref:DUF6651 domain-containing protein n=2 Tax=Acinetobacter baumannii TaxID=470 RepID=A0A009R8F9_ACIBA|nr:MULTISPECIES: DUF6651 domain-containing protein [Acinetobacter]UUG68492.1 hypothetical protein [Acinetobacter phage TCUAN1]EHU1527872.1 hypothetical protein [Acinetobacter baumannii]EHU1539728.1 hypothetical protein [Acinetobacter baumannii]EHU2002683.1 hypothetical protein [Acinetobacter baumannii]EKU6036786.1 hypothetical protein [Acinetobacter nosocomialis]